jgi:tryptophan synthase alpha chain
MNGTKISLMSHLIPFFPDLKSSLEIGRIMAESGADILEVQFPYSDPTADGPVIQEACSTALANDFSISEGFRFIEELSRTPGPKIYLMVYAGLLYAGGVIPFIEKAKKSGVSAIIVPDLPVDHDEGFYTGAKKRGVDPVPVLSPGMTDSRINAVMEASGSSVYATLRSGITGAKTELGDENRSFLKTLKTYGKKVMAGFGVDSRELALAVSEYADTVVAGSVFMAPFLSDRETGFTELRKKLRSIIYQ